MTNRRCTTLILAALWCAGARAAPPAPPPPAGEVIGTIQNLQGTVSIARAGATLPATVGTALYRGDQVRTGKPGAVGIVLGDDTTISAGSSSELAINDYLFDPNNGKFALVVRMLKGTFSYITGQIGKLAPDTVKVRTPDATIATRGTKVLIEIKE
ncbi:FecR domain-containing protein [Duganella sp. FT3S]|uniref:FecR domain-containing protein n=1 Tax=Rugamonas fusca TaxID=2758568 RepID=A0A7W2EL51_9BURK|nr:FecR domain-containing protein [Rugamonas fusca]MBA5607913.1 FecR domain-containing protein [Rugamonas fusca]